MENSAPARVAQLNSTPEPQKTADVHRLPEPERYVPGDVTQVNDAKIYGSLSDDILDRPLRISMSPVGSKTMPGRWRDWKEIKTARDLLNKFSIHIAGEKDGYSLLQGYAIDGDRKANAIEYLDLLILDIDVGQQIEDIRIRLQELGLFAIVHTSHSHLKPISDIKKDAVVKWLGGGDISPDIEQVKAYLIQEKRYQPWVLEDASILKTEHTSEGVKIFVAHQPMPKFRVVLILKDRFVIADRQGTQADAIAEWKQRYAGASKLLGAFYDRSCVDPSRLFYLPRHPKGAQEYRIEVIGGKPLDLETVERVTERESGGTAYDQAARSETGARDYKTDGMLWFFKKYGDLFDIDTFLLENDPDGDRGSRPRGAGRTHRCPNDDAHTNAGDDSDVGFFCVNATESETGKAVAHCRHDSCSQMDRIDFTDLICEKVGITSANDLMKWVPEVIDEHEEKPGVAYAAYRNIAEVNRAVKDIPKGNKDAGQFVAICLGMSTAIGATQKDDIRKQIAAITDISIATLRKEEKAGLAKLGAVSEDFLDDDTMKELMALNKEYAIVTLGDKVKIMQRQARGDAPLFRSRDDFNFLMANRRVQQQDAAGNAKWVSIAVPWSQWKDRREYDRVVFEPPPVDCPENWCNTWSGFPIDGVSGDWSLLRGHIFENICLSKQDYFDWLMTWMADIVQHPGDKKGSCVVIKGKKGAGKSNPFDWLRKLLGEAMALKVSQRDHIVGQFNAHQQGKLLLVCEEALWAGDKAVEGVLKDLITSDEMMMTPKGIDSVKVSNHMRLALISNEAWVCPAGLEDERRFFVLHCGNARISDTTFFGQVKAQMKKGGLHAMMHELMTWKPTMFEDGWNTLRKPPVTPWLKEQGEHGLSPAHLFVEHLVSALEEFHDAKALDHYHYYRVGKPMTHEDIPEEIGGINFNATGQTIVRGLALQAEFNAWAKEFGISNRGNKGGASFSDTLASVFGIARTHTEKGKVYTFPPIAFLRLKLGHVDALADVLTQADSVENRPDSR